MTSLTNRPTMQQADASEVMRIGLSDVVIIIIIIFIKIMQFVATRPKALKCLKYRPRPTVIQSLYV